MGRVLSRVLEWVQASLQKCPGSPPPQKKYCYHYSKKVTILEKSSRRDEVRAHEVGIPCLRTLYDKEHDHD